MLSVMLAVPHVCCFMVVLQEARGWPLLCTLNCFGTWPGQLGGRAMVLKVLPLFISICEILEGKGL